MATTAEGRRIRITGTVQGVGLRPWVYRAAVAAGVTGRVRNDSCGVTVDAFGDPESVDRFENTLHHHAPAAARIASFDSVDIPLEEHASFVIEPSVADADRRVSIPPDLATCDDCVAEIFDPSDRRYRYPFTNCTNCGPRFTIARDVPYDRATTTMASFPMCAPCRSEYEHVLDRRFHAQPTACPDCGPQITTVRLKPDTTPGAPASTVVERRSSGAFADAIAEAAAFLRAGLIVGVKGIGGFHLACDATSETAVTRLRARKHRDEKPLAVMVRTLNDAESLAELTPAHRALLTSTERPIVLAAKRVGPVLAPSIAPRNRQIGLMLPYSPLHHLLLADTGRPLVMTSGNLSEEPIAFTNEDAITRLDGIADLLLVHDRDIQTRCDDSVTTVIDGAPLVIRRSRGYVPRAVNLATPLQRRVLATGALLKNTFCLAAGSNAYLGPHIGDLENLETWESYVTAIERFERFVDIRPEVIACDMHPDYMSTMYAQQRAERTIAVQHHHAHIVAAMVEHGLPGPAIGIAYDGTGYGTDGTSWGGEILLATRASYERLATFRPIALAGGDRAVREPWRIAVALAVDAYDGAIPHGLDLVLKSTPPHELNRVAGLIGSNLHVSRARGLGRYFDGFGALFLDRRRATFEGQIALEWNQIADPSVRRVYPFDVSQWHTPSEIDFRPTVRAALDDAMAGVAASVISAAFHNTIAAATAAAVGSAARSVGRLPVVASGGCFQNARLAESIVRELEDFDVRLHRDVPPGDGGIALGQAIVADAIAAAASR